MSGFTELDRTSIKAKALSLVSVSNFDDAARCQAEWDGLVTRTGSDVYQTYDWCRIWWKYYGRGRRLHILLFFAADELVGLIPAFTEKLWLGPVSIRVARMVGADHTLTLCNLAISKERLKACVSMAKDYFLSQEQCDTFLVGPLAGPSADIEQISEIGSEGGPRPALTIGNSCNTYFSLPKDFKEYLANLGKKHRSNYTRNLNQLQKAHAVRFDVVSEASQVGLEFEQFSRLHAEQWAKEGKLGHFGDWPHALEFNREMVNALGGQGKVRFHRILAGDRVVSSQFCYVNGATNYWRLPARASEDEWLRYSFGYMGLIKMLEASIAEGHSIVEGGRGHYDYKLHFGGKEWPLRTVQFLGANSLAPAKIMLFRAASRIFTIGYYKILFARVAPRVRALRKPLWSAWIRRDW